VQTRTRHLGGEERREWCVWGGESLTAVRVRQDGDTPLHLASLWSHPSTVEWITERLPYQVLERANDGVCVCVI
jgi:hypothetical protein